jgi:hypothetical protein
MKIPKTYFYDPNDLAMKPLSSWKLVLYAILTITFLSSISFIYGRITKITNLSDLEKEILIVDINNQNNFTQDKLVDLLKDLNVKYPHIVLAQARLETGGYKSRIFRENNNLFGMRQATVRINTASGTQHNHAYYETWEESVYDYAFYQARYLSGAKSESDYLYIIGQSYAEDPTYINKLKREIENKRLRSLF